MIKYYPEVSGQLVGKVPGRRPFGDRWNLENQSAVLRVPSAIIPTEWNYLLNINHPDIEKVSLTGVEQFLSDDRLQGKWDNSVRMRVSMRVRVSVSVRVRV
jgi:hypothetical protein